jgi:hypothetical protein
MDYRLPKPFVYLLSVAFFSAFGAVSAQGESRAERSPAIMAAEQAMQQARRARADAVVPADYANAERALADAETLVLKRRRGEADRMALRAQRLAELAAVNARYLLLKDEVDRKTTANAALRRELLMGSGAKP